MKKFLVVLRFWDEILTKDEKKDIFMFVVLLLCFVFLYHQVYFVSGNFFLSCFQISTYIKYEQFIDCKDMNLSIIQNNKMYYQWHYSKIRWEILLSKMKWSKKIKKLVWLMNKRVIIFLKILNSVEELRKMYDLKQKRWRYKFK